MKRLTLLLFIISNFMSSQENWTIYNNSNSDLSFGSVSDIEFDSQGNKWVASFVGFGDNGNGLTKFDDTNWTTFNTDNSNIGTNQVTDISIDNIDNKWLGTRDNGLIKFDDTNWLNFTTNNSDLPNDRINSIANDDNGNIWIGTPSGLTKFDGINWTNYNTSNSDLPSNEIYSIAIDDNNNVWLTTTNELVEFTDSSWNIYKCIDVFTGFYSSIGIGNSFGPNSLRIDSSNRKIMVNFGDVLIFDDGDWEFIRYGGGTDGPSAVGYPP